MTAMSTVTKMQPNEHMMQSIIKIGEAMIFGEELGSADNVAQSDPIPPITANREYAELIEWVAEDYQHHSAFLGNFVSQITTWMPTRLFCTTDTSGTEYVIDSEALSRYAQKSFSDDSFKAVKIPARTAFLCEIFSNALSSAGSFLSSFFA